MTLDLAKIGATVEGSKTKTSRRKRVERDRYLLNKPETPFLKLSKYLESKIETLANLGMRVSADYRLELNLNTDNIDPIPPEILELYDLETLAQFALSIGLETYNDINFVRLFWVAFFKISRNLPIMTYDNLVSNSEYYPARVIWLNQRPAESEKEILKVVSTKAKRCILRHIFFTNVNLFNDNQSLRAEFSRLKRDLKKDIYWSTLLEEFPQLVPGFKEEPVIDNEKLVKILIEAFYKIARYYTEDDQKYIESLKQAQEQ